MSGIAPSRSLLTCCALVGLTCFDLLADGAAIGTPHARMNCLATGCDGILTPTVLSPALTRSGTASLLGKMTVIGPGMNASAISLALCGTSVTSPSS